MNDMERIFKAATVQATPVFLNKKATPDKASSLIAEAGRNDPT